MPAQHPTWARILAVIALVTLAITSFLCFESTETTMQHLIGGLALGLAFIAAALVV